MVKEKVKPKNEMKEVYEFFKKKTKEFHMPKLSETPLGIYLAKRKEEKLEDCSLYELNMMLEQAQKDTILLELQNSIFEQFLLKNDPRFDPDNLKNYADLGPTVPVKPLVFTSKELMEKKRDSSEDIPGKPDTLELTNLCYYTRVIEHEMKVLHKNYQKDVRKHNRKMDKILSEQKGAELHLEKIIKTQETLDSLVISQHKKKITVDPEKFAAFLKLTIKQDKQDIRRLKVMVYDVQKKCKELAKAIQMDKPILKVDIDKSMIIVEELKKELDDHNEQFVQIKNIYDMYCKKIDNSKKELDAHINKLNIIAISHGKIKKQLQNFIYRRDVNQKRVKELQKEKQYHLELINRLSKYEQIPNERLYVTIDLEIAQLKSDLKRYNRRLGIKQNTLKTYKTKCESNRNQDGLNK